MTIPAGVIIPWPSSNGAIPGGWTRYTALDGRYPKQLANMSSNPGATGGSSTHTHSSNAHAHTVTHSHTATSSSEDGDYAAGNIPLGGSGVYDTSDSPHTHAETFSTATAGSGTGTTTWDAATNDPPYYAMIWIQSDGTPTGVPPNACALWLTQTLPPFWTQHTASSGRYLRGAASGADGGITGGDQHNHTGTATHTHSGVNHSHGGFSGPPLSSTNWSGLTSGFSAVPPGSHNHAINAAAAAIGNLSSANGSTTGARAIGIPSVNVTVIQNKQTSNQQPVGMIGLWAGTLATIPAGWFQVTYIAADRFLKSTAALTTVTQTGGALGHTHTGPTHFHTQGIGHSHTSTLTAEGSFNQITFTSSGLPPPPALYQHAHSVSATSSVNFTNSSAEASSVNTVADDRPLYTEVALIQLGGPMSVAITLPANNAVVTRSDPIIAWALSSTYVQNDYRLFVYAADGVTVVYDSGRVTAARLNAAVPSGYLQTGQTYKLQVVVNDTVGDNAISPQITITTSWTAPTPLTSIAILPVGTSLP